MVEARRTSRLLARPLLSAAFLLAGGGLWAAGRSREAVVVWTAGLWLLGLPLLFQTGRGVFKGRFAADLVAALAIVASMALAHPLAGLIIVLMQTGGEALEHIAERRASAAVRALEADAPRIAHRLEAGGLQDIDVEQVAVGDRILVRPGEMVPCDAVVAAGSCLVDASRLTGEPVPVRASPGTALRSGALVVDGALTLTVTALSRESLYARIVELVRSAQASKAPLQRLADRYAVWFTPVTLGVAALAFGLSGDPDRVLAVLVVATPCPLILATPVAIIGGINRAARRQIIMRHGGALEALSGVDTALFDKTGTLTVGRPEVARVDAVLPFTQETVLRLAAAVEQGSGHLLARTLVDAARHQKLELPHPADIVEVPGLGVTGMVDGRQVTVGAFSLIQERAPGAAAALMALNDTGPTLRAYVAVDGRPAGTVTYADRLRGEAAHTVSSLRALGIASIGLLSGDRADNVVSVARSVGITEVAADLTPENKVAHVIRLTKAQHRVLMVGDGTNDAPALSAAAVGLALGAHGGGIVAEAADVVLLVDDLERIPLAISIGRRTLRIARQGIWVGLGLSALAMVAAAAGRIPPTVGALLQEGIDVAVILNALRAAREARLMPSTGMVQPVGATLLPDPVPRGGQP